MSKKHKLRNDGIIRDGDYLPVGKKLILGLQHAFTMFGATVLVPILTGLDVSIALLAAGIGTLIFHFITKGKMPVFLGSSFAFIAVIVKVRDTQGLGLDYAVGGLVIAGLFYLLMALLVKLLGAQRIMSFFPAIVTGPIIMVIGLNLAPVAVGMASTSWLLAFICLAVVMIVSLYTKGFIRVLPVLCALIFGYLTSLVFKFTGFMPEVIDFTTIKEAALVGLPWGKLSEITVAKIFPAKFSLEAILIIAPVAIVTVVEHIGDVLAVGATVEKDFTKEPGLHRTLLGDGIATALAGFIGGPANTTYSENTGVLALTKVWNPVIMRIAAVFAIILSLSPKFGAVIDSIPDAVVGGISIVLFGMIASIGVRTVVENKVDFSKSRNLIISAVILVLGIGGAVFDIKIGSLNLQIAGMALGAFAGILLNKVLPQDQ